MKKFLLMFFLLTPSLVFGSNGKVYYCSETEKVGFKDDNKKFQRFSEKRFKILIDFDKPFIKSSELLMNEHMIKSCHLDDPDNQVYCYSIIGNSFTINKKTLNFVYTHTIPGDSILISHGKCETF